jgi:flagellar biosynthetic protein FlhB
MNDDKENSQEKTEEATERRLKELREQGSVSRSREFNNMIGLFSGVAFFYFFGANLFAHVVQIFQDNLQLERKEIFDQSFLFYQLQSVGMSFFYILFPLFVMIIIFSLLSNLMVGGWLFSFKIISPKLERINPVAGFKRVFSVKSLSELVKSLLKFFLVCIFSVVCFFLFKNDLLRFLEMETLHAIFKGFNLLWIASVVFLIPLIIIATIDVPFQRWAHAKQSKMSKFELKEEYKETEGKPEVKQKIKQLQQRLARSRMMANVPKADVIITNPDHYAIALQYNKKEMDAPIVLAKGMDLVAEKIREIAKENKIPLVSAPPLARALYYSVDIGGEIPRGLYVAVAQVLAYIHQLNLYFRGQSQKPVLPKDWDIPPELRR